jgi:hypothetical protein
MRISVPTRGVSLVLMRIGPPCGWNSISPRPVAFQPCQTAVNRAGGSSRRQAPLTNILSMAAEDMLADATWQNISWRTGSKGKLEARFATVRVRVADGPPQRIRDKGQQHLPGDRLGSSANTAVRVLSGEKPGGLPVQRRLRDDRQRLKATNDRCGAPPQFVSRTGETQLRQSSQ